MRIPLASPLAVALLVACAGPSQPERGTYAPPEGSCMDNEAGRDYFASVWRALQDAWELPKGIPDDQRVEVMLEFDAQGNPKRPVVVEETNADLRASVEKALGAADLPQTPDELRACIATHRITGTFRNTNRR